MNNGLMTYRPIEGYCHRGDCEILTAEECLSGRVALSEEARRVLVVYPVQQSLRSYPMAECRSDALESLIRMAGGVTPEAVSSFVKEHGLLLELPSWLDDYLHVMADGENAVVLSNEGDNVIQPISRQSSIAGRLSIACLLGVFFDWCDKEASEKSRGAADYLRAWLLEIRRDPYRHTLIPQPLALYQWAGSVLSGLRQALLTGRTEQPDDLLLLGALIADQRLEYWASDKKLTISASSLLTHLAVTMMLEAIGPGRELRVCEACGQPFPSWGIVKRFCSDLCQDRAKKRRKRSMQRLRVQEAENG